jgi:hypothetical protein
MNTTMSCGLIRLVAGPVVAAGIIGGALGLAAVANAATVSISPHAPNSTYTAAVKEQAGDGTYQPGKKKPIPGGITTWPTSDVIPAQPTIVYPHAVQTQPMQPRIDTGTRIDASNNTSL